MPTPTLNIGFNKGPDTLIASAGKYAYISPGSLLVPVTSGAQDPLVFMTNLNTSTSGYLTGAHGNVFGASVLNTNGSYAGVFSFPSSGQTGANCTMNDHSTGNTGLAPAILSLEIESSLGSNNAANITAGQQWKSRGNVILVYSWWADNPVVGSGSGPTNITNATAVLSPGAAQTLYLSQCDAVVSALAQVNGPVFLRPLLEPNLSRVFWWDLGQFSAAQYIQLWQMTYNRIFVTNAAKNIYIIFTQNWNGTFTYMTQWPGQAYVHAMGMDYYDTTVTTGNINQMYGPITAQSSSPILFTECGYNGDNSDTVPFANDSSQWSSSTLRSTFPQLKGSILWCQAPSPEDQLNTKGYLGGTLCLNSSNTPALK